jgi:hypothetical protein
LQFVTIRSSSNDPQVWNYDEANAEYYQYDANGVRSYNPNDSVGIKLTLVVCVFFSWMHL